MPMEIKMPQLGESVHEGTIGRWLKRVGDRIEKYEPLLEVITDKVESEVTSPATGLIEEIRVNEGETVKVGTVLALVALDQATTIPDQAANATMTEIAVPPQESVKPQHTDGGAPSRISPIVARMALEHNIDLKLVRGTGLEGRVTKQDLLAYIEAHKQEIPRESEAAPVQPTEERPLPKSDVPAPEVLPLSPLRRAIAEHMVRSKHTSAHVTTVFEADLQQLVKLREAQKSAFEEREGVSLTYTTFFVAAVVEALRDYPILNSTMTDEGIRLHKQVNIGVAVALEDGLIVPVIHRAEEKSLLRLARDIYDLSSRARSRKLQPDEVAGGTFTITNHGVNGSLFATPIINQPQAAILGVGAIQKRVVVTGDDAIAVHPMVYLTLTFDHRILDGAIADHFMLRLVGILEQSAFLL
ncbi:MAG: 2-oxo acid dehydrogenase subunit E2 [Chloroflexi bacterium]|nr:2-oxo acid dehydrogenase subunit E2 [Chloroflexota bacterium]